MPKRALRRRLTFRPLTIGDVEAVLTIEPEDIPVRGAFDSGEAELDRQDEDRIIERLERDDQWAWCCVVVTVRWRDFSEFATLGGCSYADEADFRRCGEFDQLRDEAIDFLNEKIAKTLETIRPRLRAA